MSRTVPPASDPGRKPLHRLDLIPQTELTRRQLGAESLFRLGQLSLQDLDARIFLEAVLDGVALNLRADAALFVPSDPTGPLGPIARGFPPLVEQLRRLLAGSSVELARAERRDVVTLIGDGNGFAVLAAPIPGHPAPHDPGAGAGTFCVGRNRRRGRFLPDEKELLAEYAQATALGLQTIRVRERLARNGLEIVSSFVIALEAKDVYLEGHSLRVSRYAGELAVALRLSQNEVAVARRAGLLHDLGKLATPDAILLKRGPLTDEQHEEMRRHPILAGRMLEPFRALAREGEAVRHHHERWDGGGYPDGLAGNAIPLAARIVAVADALDAMTTDRPYRRARALDAALAEIHAEAGRHFDPAAAAACAAVPQGRLVEISHTHETERESILEALTVARGLLS